MADPDDADIDALKKEKLRAYEASLGGFELKAFEALERDFQEVLYLATFHLSFLLYFMWIVSLDSKTHLIIQDFSILMQIKIWRFSPFLQVLQELQQDKSLDRFRGEYEKLHRALKKSHG